MSGTDGTGLTTKQKKAIKARDMSRVIELYLTGVKQVDIALQVGIGQMTVSRYLQEAQKNWLKNTVHDVNILKARELQKIDAMELVYWDGWRRSMDSPAAYAMHGDVRFLNGIQWCVEQRCKILGISANVNANLNIDLTSLTDEQLQRLSSGESLYAVLSCPQLTSES